MEAASLSPAPPDPSDPIDTKGLVAEAYNANRSLYDRLEEEVGFILRRALPLEIKLHSTSSRIKGLDSVVKKADHKGYADALSDMHDIVGFRVVCLFRSDIALLASAIRGAFDVQIEHDTIEGDQASEFGYMAVHFDAHLPRTCVGPRYDGLVPLTFEIQLRTLLMDAWANVSHHLDYKRESSIPTGLQRDFYALSGLFYIADRHFEMFMQSSDESLRRAETDLDRSPGVRLDREELNADTLFAYLTKRYPERRGSTRNQASVLAAQLIDGGLKTLADVDVLLNRAEDAVLHHERSRERAHDPYFSGIGMARVAAQLLVPSIRDEFKTRIPTAYEHLEESAYLVRDG